MKRRDESIFAAAVAAYSAGAESAVICNRHGITVTTLRRYLAEAGIPWRNARKAKQSPTIERGNLTPAPYARGYRYFTTSW